MKRIALPLMALTLTLGVVSCGSADEESTSNVGDTPAGSELNPDPTPTPSPTTTPVVYTRGYCIISTISSTIREVSTSPIFDTTSPSDFDLDSIDAQCETIRAAVVLAFQRGQIAGGPDDSESADMCPKNPGARYTVVHSVIAEKSDGSFMTVAGGSTDAVCGQ